MGDRIQGTIIVAVIVVVLGATAFFAVRASTGENRGDTVSPTRDTAVASTPTGEQEAEIAVRDNEFEPGRLTVEVGTTVTWRWEGQNAHRIVGTATGDLESEEQSSGEYTFRFDVPGTVEYHCSIHGQPVMSGTIEVVN